MKNLNALKTKRNDLLQQRADALDAANTAYSGGNTADYESNMTKVKGFNTELERISGLIAEVEKEFDIGDLSGAAGQRNIFSGKALVDTIRGTDKYAEAWLKAMREGISPDKGANIKALEPLYEAENAFKALSIGGGETVGEDGGFLVPVDFDNQVKNLMKEYIDLSELVTVENVKVNSGWRVVDAAGARVALTKVGELDSFKEGQKPKYKKVTYTCEKYGEKLIVSNELMSDASALIAYLAAWWAPKFVMTKNSLILSKLSELPFSALDGATDAEQIKALKTMLNTGLNTAHAKRATILTNAFGYDTMDNWVDGTGRAMLVPDLKAGGPDKFKGRPVVYADADLVPSVEHDGTAYDPIYLGNFKNFCTLFLRQGVRVRSTDIGGQAWDTDTTEIKCSCRMDCQIFDENAVKSTGIMSAEEAALMQELAEEQGEEQVGE